MSSGWGSGSLLLSARKQSITLYHAIASREDNCYLCTSVWCFSLVTIAYALMRKWLDGHVTTPNNVHSGHLRHVIAQGRSGRSVFVKTAVSRNSTFAVLSFPTTTTVQHDTFL